MILSVLGLARMSTKCCGYGTSAADETRGFDCALIPGATMSSTANNIAQTLAGAANGFCGGELGVISGNAAAATICCKYI